jgi:hypothetical protein
MRWFRAVVRLPEAARLAQHELAELIGTDQANIARLETGRSLATKPRTTAEFPPTDTPAGTVVV